MLRNSPRFFGTCQPIKGKGLFLCWVQFGACYLATDSERFASVCFAFRVDPAVSFSCLCVLEWELVLIATSDKKGKGDVRLARSEGRLQYRRQLAAQNFSSGHIRNCIIRFNQETEGIPFNDVVRHVTDLLVGDFYRSFLRRLQRRVADQGWSDSASEDLPEQEEPSSSSKVEQ